MSRNALAEADDFGFPLCRILSGFWVKVFRFSSTFQRGDVPTALQSLLNEGFAHANIDLSATPGSCLSDVIVKQMPLVDFRKGFVHNVTMYCA